ncbi:coil containing protein [Vibrio phage 1.064.O._10N.261.52.E2]|nr:coil containing protein [Vibrio phage 1.064.O._10N.261.52.E2]AUR88112.1 coil containing protein [Vibrio phage 1.108.O._10N.222.51.A4]AUR95394.1 coil containing protein [Vibrio phage 1.206.O._10N.222.51.B10]AUR97486.1 coil containing protein [Vibrio phage 1.239.O._10N.261.52.F6]
MRITINEIDERLWDSVDRVCKFLLPNGKKEAHEWCVGSTGGESGKSLKVNLAGKRKWTDFASGEGGDMLDLWVNVRSIQLHDAIKEAKEFLGIKDDDQYFAKAKKQYSKPDRKNLRKGEAHIEYLKTRGISEETIKEFKVAQCVVWDHDNKREVPGMAFPYLRGSDCLFIKSIGIERNNGKKIIGASKDCEPLLFGWQAFPNDLRACIICEGEIDAMSFHEYGIPALSVPFGGGKGAKQQWIDTEFHNMDRFDEIVICMDSDEAGQEAAREIAERIGIERCRIAELPYKDANECLLNGVTEDEIWNALERARFLDPEELANASAFLQDTIDAFYKTEQGLFQSPWPNLNYNFQFRESEISLFNGVNGHGKSQVVGHLMLEAMRQNTRCCVASMELKPGILLKRLTRQATCAPTPPEDEIRKANNFMASNLWLFSLTGTAKAEKMLDIFKYANRRYGIKLFIIDSLMKCGIGETDYDGQKEFMDKLCDFKNKYNCHVILVTHSRKGDNEEKPTGKMDVKGTGAVTDLADNVFIIWRNKIGERAIEARLAGEQVSQKEEEFAAMPGAILILDKQRNGEGWEGKVGLSFDRESNQYLAHDGGKQFNYLYGRCNEEMKIEEQQKQNARR